MKLLSVILLLSLQRAKTATGPFCYHDPKCDPRTWPKQYPSCNGTHQSPIDVLTYQAQRNDHLGPFNLTGYSNPQFLLNIKHTKHTGERRFQPLPTPVSSSSKGTRKVPGCIPSLVNNNFLRWTLDLAHLLSRLLHEVCPIGNIVNVRVTTNTQMVVSGGGLPGDYLTSQFHFHWGNQTTAGGSEHRLDGHQANMELHIVNIRKDPNMRKVRSQTDGFAVLSFLIEVEHNITENPAWKNLTSLIKHLGEDGDMLPLNGTISLMDLISGVNLTRYYRYNGSFTTPLCDEGVLWTVFEEPIRLNASLVETFFTDLYVNRSQGILLHNTFRQPQKNTNRVWASQGASRATTTLAPILTVFPTAGSPLTSWAHPLCLLLPLASIWLGGLSPSCTE